MGECRYEKVLVVDDDERLLASWKRSMGKQRNLLVASARDEAVKLAMEEQPELAVVDLRLGGESGIDVIRELKRVQPEIQIALCSGYLSVATAVVAVRAGADVVLFKPVSLKEVLRRFEKCEEEPANLDETPTLARAEWEHIMRVLADCNGNVSMAARKLGIYRSSLQRRLRKYAPRS
jgi:two-component system, response regulator RegA